MKQRNFPANHRKRVQRSKRQRENFYKSQHRRCWYCGSSPPKKNFRLEHQIPFSKGGDCRLHHNVVLACPNCDREKGSRTVEEYRKYLSDKHGVPILFWAEVKDKNQPRINFLKIGGKKYYHELD